MRISKKGIAKSITMILLLVCTMSMTVFAAEETVAKPSLYATVWALIPPVVAIVLALITKEVYSSLLKLPTLKMGSVP